MYWKKFLQWSHRFSAVETGGKVGQVQLHHHPSMEPPLFGSGNLRCMPSLGHDLLPSMEPPLFGSGNWPLGSCAG